MKEIIGKIYKRRKAEREEERGICLQEKEA